MKFFAKNSTLVSMIIASLFISFGGFARKRGILKKDIFDGILLKESYDCPPSEGYAWISDQADLESLISYVLNYRSPISSIKKL